jgi:hypothetical protein
MSRLWLVCDVSGSMLEAGKRLIVRSLVREVEQYIGLGYGATSDIRLVAWNNDAKSLPWSPQDEVPVDLFDCKNSADGEVLTRLLGSRADDRFIVLTDGFWSDESRVAIKQWKEGLTPDALRVIKVGADANPKLKGPDVFDAEDFFAAMDGWLDK